MRLYTPDGRRVRATKVKRFRMSWVGRSWDYRDKIVDGKSIAFHFDSYRGRRMYFQWQGAWYAASMSQDNDPFEVKRLFTSVEQVRASAKGK